MQPKQIVTIVLVTILLSACATSLNVSEINSLNRSHFDPLQISVGNELYNLRIDIIRQTDQNQLGSSETETVERPYHPVGFDLGNGLFFDLNENLSFRIDYLMNFDPYRAFGLSTSYLKHEKPIKACRFRNDTLFMAAESLFGASNTFALVRRSFDSISYTNVSWNPILIWREDSVYLYGNRKRIVDRVFMKDDNHYYRKSLLATNDYRLEDGEVTLSGHYLIRLAPEQDRIDIFANGFGKKYLLYSIVKGGNKIFIYNSFNYGKKLESEEGKLRVFNGDLQLYEYKLYD